MAQFIYEWSLLKLSNTNFRAKYPITSLYKNFVPHKTSNFDWIDYIFYFGGKTYGMMDTIFLEIKSFFNFSEYNTA